MTDPCTAPGADWPCLALARRADPGRRLPVHLGEGPAAPRLGSVDRDHLDLLHQAPSLCRVEADAVVLLPPGGQALGACLAPLHQAWREAGRIRAWRDEPYPWLDEQGRLQAVIERAASRFWGALTFGAHCNGHVLDAAGRPSHLWIARRSRHKPTDPGRLDNLIGGGVPHGQTPRQALLREAWEEAGLAPDQMTGLQAGGVFELCCEVPEGLQREWLHVYDLALPPGLVPVNQDGEVEEHRLMPVDEALARAAAGELTTDAALATLDFALRHRLLPAAAAAPLAARLEALRVPQALAARFDPPGA